MPEAKYGMAISAESDRDSFPSLLAAGQGLLRDVAWETASWEEPDALARAATKRPHYLVGVLPRAETAAATPTERVAKMISRLQSWSGCLSEVCEVAILVQFSGGRFGDAAQPNHWECGSASAFAKSVHLEAPQTRMRVLDFAPSASVHVVSNQIHQSLVSSESFQAESFESIEGRMVPRARSVSSEEWPVRTLDWSSDDVVLVTGGGKGITAECALALARRTRVRCALTGRSQTSDPEVQRTLARFQQAELVADWFPADLSHSRQVADLVRNVRRQMGPVTAVIHGAGRNIPRRVTDVSSEQAMREIGPKVCGALHLREHLPSEALKFVAALTSSIGVTGMPGNAWYAFSNELLHALLRDWRQASAVQVQAVAFGLWAEVGMGAKLGVADRLASQGIDGISSQEGTQRFVELFLRDPGRTQVVVSARLGNLPTWPAATERALEARERKMRFLEEILLHEPGVEVLSRAKLNLDRDPYLADHDYHGSLLFPTVFGLEAMAQVATAALGPTQLPIRAFQNIQLERPIVVDPRRGCRIEIRAVVRTASAPASACVDVAIRSEQTGFEKDHFSASIVFQERELAPQMDRPIPTTSLDIDGRRDLYGSILFQGGRFQRIEEVLELDENQVAFNSQEFQPGKAALAELDWHLCLGDPFFRDNLLQAGQLTIPQEQCLPIAIERLEFFAKPTRDDSRRIVFAPWKIREDDQYRAEVFATDAQGAIQERLTGYRLQILDRRGNAPTVADLLAPQRRDQTTLNNLFEEYRGQTGAETIGAVYSAGPAWGKCERDQRRERVEPHVQEARRRFLSLTLAQSLDETSEPPATLSWAANGRPMLQVMGEENEHVSITHDDFGCLCVVGKAPQGVDLEPLLGRSREAWLALLTQRHVKLFDLFLKQGDSVDVAGARIWTANEAFRKATGCPPQSMRFSQRFDKFATLTVSGAGPEGERTLVIATCPLTFTLGPPRVLAWAPCFNQSEESCSSEQLPATAAAPNSMAAQKSLDASGGIPADWHCVRVAQDGPHGQPVQELRIVVSFQDASSAARRVPASRYLSWMGRLRELVTAANVPDLVPQIESGEWGLVTNWGELQTCGELTANDVVQMRFWTEDPTESSVVFFCEFQRVGQAGLERVAIARQQATWVKIVGHGRVQPEPFPKELAEFIAQMGPSRADSGSPSFERESKTHPFAIDESPDNQHAPTIDLAGSESFEIPIVLQEDVLQTTFAESNLVGNIYFANYFHWQQRLFDLFAHELGMKQAERRSSETTNGLVEIESWRTLTSRVDYLREAIPLDRIAIVMSLRQIGRSHLVLGFEYSRIEEDGHRLKLAVGEQTVVRTLRHGAGPTSLTEIPECLRETLFTHQRRPE